MTVCKSNPEEFARLWNAGIPAAEIAKRLGYTNPASVSGRARSLGLKTRNDRGRNIERDREIMACHRRGMSCVEISKEFGICSSRVSKIIGEMRERFPVAAVKRAPVLSASPQAIARALAKMERRA